MDFPPCSPSPFFRFVQALAYVVLLVSEEGYDSKRQRNKSTFLAFYFRSCPEAKGGGGGRDRGGEGEKMSSKGKMFERKDY